MVMPVRLMDGVLGAKVEIWKALYSDDRMNLDASSVMITAINRTIIITVTAMSLTLNHF
jgi:hypothetical protein